MEYWGIYIDDITKFLHNSVFNNATKVQSFFELQTHFIYFLSLYFLVSTFFSTFAQVFKTEKNV